MQFKLSRQVRREDTTTMTLRGVDVINMLNLWCQMKEDAPNVTVPPHADVTFTVPGGADWSGTELELDSYPIVVSWSEVTETEPE